MEVQVWGCLERLYSAMVVVDLVVVECKNFSVAQPLISFPQVAALSCSQTLVKHCINICLF